MISTKGRYAIRFMIDLAEQPEGAVVPLEDSANRQGISKKYLESVVKPLVTGKLVKGTSGKGGGYRLLRAPKDYSVAEILKVTEGSMATVACLQDDADECPRQCECKTLPMWREFDEMIQNFFKNKTLEQLVHENS